MQKTLHDFHLRNQLLSMAKNSDPYEYVLRSGRRSFEQDAFYKTRPLVLDEPSTTGAPHATQRSSNSLSRSWQEKKGPSLISMEEKRVKQDHPKKIAVRSSSNMTGNYEARSPTSFQLLQISKGAQKLNQMIHSWSNRPNIDSRSREIARELSRGTLDLEDSLIMLGKLQKASRYKVHSQKKEKKREGLEREGEEEIEEGLLGRDQRSIHEREFDKPRLSVDGSLRNGAEDLKEMIRESLYRQNLLPQTQSKGKSPFLNQQKLNPVSEFSSGNPSRNFASSVKGKSEKTILDYGTKAPLSVLANSKPKRHKAPNVIAKLMGLEELPVEKASPNISARRKSQEFVSERISEILAQCDRKENHPVSAVRMKPASERSLISQSDQRKKHSGVTVTMKQDAEREFMASQSDQRKKHSGVTVTMKQDTEREFMASQSDQRKKHSGVTVTMKQDTEREFMASSDQRGKNSVNAVQMKPDSERNYPFLDDRGERHRETIVETSHDRGRSYSTLSDQREKYLAAAVSTKPDRERNWWSNGPDRSKLKEIIDSMHSKGILKSTQDELQLEAIDHGFHKEPKADFENFDTPPIVIMKPLHFSSSEEEDGSKPKLSKEFGVSVPENKQNKPGELDVKRNKKKPASTAKKSDSKDQKHEKRESAKIAEKGAKPQKEMKVKSDIISLKSVGVSRFQGESMTRKPSKTLNQVKKDNDNLMREKQVRTVVSGRKIKGYKKKPTKPAQDPNVTHKTAEDLNYENDEKGSSFMLEKHCIAISTSPDSVLQSQIQTIEEEPVIHLREHLEEDQFACFEAPIDRTQHQKSSPISPKSSNDPEHEIWRPEKSHKDLQKLLLNSPSFHTLAQELFNLSTTLPPLSLSKTSLEDDERIKPIMDCVHELATRKSQREALTAYPLLKQSFRSPKTKSFVDLVGELGEDMENLMTYVETSYRFFSRESIDVMLERDISCRRIDVNGVWDLGWECGFFGGEEVIREVEKHVFNGLIEETVREFV
ncbi:uncharacterized protein LOC18426613 isoform X2 [Amborella trichopoda]|uniref:uncharacterized protein LOC18426613 isoform X2 n=1 Tax=Amborella trichopoda TaxID=13333 RepID=UPI0009BFAD71|nr:uncharacterized protein LOC18426613 isoform X2 [Amborella trichopoda]|eukprot:XP_020518257.1 uncharacterized protein LOC18426613 isoform X2 [Amborella trichopoda]